MLTKCYADRWYPSFLKEICNNTREYKKNSMLMCEAVREKIWEREIKNDSETIKGFRLVFQ